MLEDYMNQDLTFEQAASANTYNETTYQAAATIRGRLEPSNALVRSQDGKTITVNSWFCTKTPVVVGDRINGRIVVSAGPETDLDGLAAFYEGYTK